MSILFLKRYRTYLITALLVTALFFVGFDIAFAKGGFDIGDFIKSSLYNIIIALGILVMSIGAFILDSSIVQLVVGMGAKLGGSEGLGGAIRNLWLIIRDLFNIFFIFSLIYIGISTILKSDDSGTRRMLGHLIIAALFINFSLYITQAITDFSNVASVQIYEQITTVGEADIGVGTLGGIPGAFLQTVGFTSLLGAPNPTDEMELSDALVYSIFMLVFLLVSGMVFAWAGLLLVTRFVALIFYMVLSPMMFLGLILPQFKKYADTWWKGFLKQCFFAPALLLGLYISLIGIQGLQSTFFAEGSGFTAVIEPGAVNPGMFGMVLYFIIMIGFLIGSIKVAQSMGAVGANAAMGSIKNLSKIAGGAGGSISGFAYRNTAGRFFNNSIKTFDSLDKLAESEKGTAGRTRAKLKRLALGGEAGRKSIERARDFKAGGTSWSDDEKQNKERTARATRALRVDKIHENLSSGDLATRQQALSDATSAQVLEMIKDTKMRDAIIKNAGSLTKSQMDTIEKSEDINDSIKEKISNSKTNSVIEKLKKVGRIEVENASKGELQTLGPAILAEAGNAAYLSKKQIDDLDFIDAHKDTIRTKRKEALEAVAKGETVTGLALTRDDLLKFKPDDIADLPKEVFVQKEFVRKLSLASLEKIYHKHNAETQKKMRTILEESPSEEMDDFLHKDRIGKNFGK